MRDVMTDHVMDWEATYRLGEDSPPPWNIGAPQPELAAVIADGGVRGDVLDAGCGHAEVALDLAARGHGVVGIDISPTAVAAAERAARERGLSEYASFVVDDITCFTGFDGCFDTVVDSTLFHSLPVALRDDYLRAVRRATAPGATLVVLTFAEGAFPTDFDGRPNEVGEDELRAAVGAHWDVSDVRPAFIHALAIDYPDGVAPSAPQHRLDEAGRTMMPAFLLTATRREDAPAST